MPTAADGSSRFFEKAGVRSPGPAELQLEFDPRLAEVWASIFETCPQVEFPEKFGWFLRMAYLQGYGDALSEDERGCLFSNLFPVAQAAPAFPPAKKGGRG